MSSSVFILLLVQSYNTLNMCFDDLGNPTSKTFKLVINLIRYKASVNKIVTWQTNCGVLLRW